MGLFRIFNEYIVTDASVHDSQAMEQLLTEKDIGQPLYADSAYTGEDQEAVYKKKKVINKIIEKGYRNKPLTPLDNSINQCGEVEVKTISNGVNRRTESQQQREIQDTCEGRARFWLCRKQYAWLHCPYYWDCKSPVK